MRYLIYSFCYETPHFETELEVAQNLINEGNEVFFLICKEDLQTCFINPEHDKTICNVCKSKISNGLKLLHLPKGNILFFNRDLIPDVNFENALTSFYHLKSFEYKGSDVGLGVISSLVSETRDHNFDVVKNKDKIIKGLKTAIMVHENFDLILNSLKPHGVVLFNGRFLESKPVLKLCEKLKINFYTHERGGQLDRYMFRENSTPHSLFYAKDEIELLWKNGPDDKIEIGKSFYKDRRNKIVQNWHVYTESQISGKLPEGFDKKKRNIAIFNSSMDEYVTIPDFENKIYNDDNNGIERICQSFLNRPEFHFYLRLHPNLRNLSTTQLLDIDSINNKYPNLTLIKAEDEIDSYSLMESVETVLSFGSTVGIEAIYWGIPSILLGRAYFENIESVLVPNSHVEVCEYILIEDKKVNSNLGAIKFGYWSLNYGKEFINFTSENLFQGKFLNKRVKANIIPRAILKLKKTIFK